MPLQFPATIETENGYRALVTSPAQGCFIFYLLNPTPYKSFQWYAPDFEGLKDDQIINRKLDNVEAEVLMAFFQLQEVEISL